MLQSGGRDSGIRLNKLKPRKLKRRKIDREYVWNQLAPLYLQLGGERIIHFADSHVLLRARD